MTYTQRALQIATRQQQVAARDNSDCHARFITFKPSGRIYHNSTRVSFEQAVQVIAAALEKEDLAKEQPAKTKAPKAAAGPMTWDKLNQATKDFFFRLGEEIQTATRDHSMVQGVRLGVEIPKISLKDAPRLSNLKKAGILETYTDNGRPKSHKFLGLTEQGQAIWAAHRG